jgi:hypothetical protein
LKPVRWGRTWEAPCGLAAAGIREREPKEDLQEISGDFPPLDAGAKGLKLRLQIRSGGAEPCPVVFWPEAKEVYQTELVRPIRLVNTVDEAIAPASDAQVNRAVCAALRPSIYNNYYADGSEHMFIAMELDRTNATALRGVGLGFRVEVLRDDEVVEALSFHADELWNWSADRSQSNHIELTSLVKRAKELRKQAGLAHWTVRVKGDGRLSLSAWDCDKYWAGEYSVALSNVLKMR